MLNRAHFLHRQAEKASLKGHLDEAIRLHQESADILRQLLLTQLNDKVAESVRLQVQLHDREQAVLCDHKKRSLATLKQIQSLRHPDSAEASAPGSPAVTAHVQSQRSSMDRRTRDCGTPDGHADDLQHSIYRKFRETESLLDQLRLQDDQWSTIASPRRRLMTFPAIPSPTSALSDAARATLDGATKRPKDDKVIIEELQVANCHLRKMVDSLFMELNSYQMENHLLQQRILQLEAKLGESSSQPDHTDQDLMTAASPRTLATATIHHHHHHPEDLPALDMPAFDFGSSR